MGGAGEEAGEDDEGTHGWLNPSLETPSSRQGAHTFPSFCLQEKDEGMQEAQGSGVRGGKTPGSSMALVLVVNRKPREQRRESFVTS